jgi:hypothetical protein
MMMTLRETACVTMCCFLSDCTHTIRIISNSSCCRCRKQVILYSISHAMPCEFPARMLG